LFKNLTKPETFCQALANIRILSTNYINLTRKLSSSTALKTKNLEMESKKRNKTKRKRNPMNFFAKKYKKKLN